MGVETLTFSVGSSAPSLRPALQQVNRDSETNQPRFSQRLNTTAVRWGRVSTAILTTKSRGTYSSMEGKTHSTDGATCFEAAECTTRMNVHGADPRLLKSGCPATFGWRTFRNHQSTWENGSRRCKGMSRRWWLPIGLAGFAGPSRCHVRIRRLGSASSRPPRVFR